MSAQSLEQKLNARADMEFDNIRRGMVAALRRPTDSFKTFTCRAWKDATGKEHTFNVLADMCSANLEVFRDDFREKFRTEFVAKVEAMHKQMESYIGELNTQQEGEQ